jgi:hypothetical protein
VGSGFKSLVGHSIYKVKPVTKKASNQRESFLLQLLYSSSAVFTMTRIMNGNGPAHIEAGPFRIRR